jgi:hypothetical protein
MDQEHARWHQTFDGFAEAAASLMDMGSGGETIEEFEERAGQARRILQQVINSSRVWFMNSRKVVGTEERAAFMEGVHHGG